MRNRIGLAAALLFVAVSCIVSPSRVNAQCDCDTVCTCPDCSIEHKNRQGRWFVLETANFQICWDQSKATAAHVARHAESWREVLCTTWLGKKPLGPWKPKCQIVLHFSQRSYVAAVGRGSERTVGSSLVRVDKGRIVSRRIDLLDAGTSFLSAALPHELTHVVLSDRFTSAVVPRWADEGMATLADTEAKQKRHHKDLRESVAHHTTYRAAELLAVDDYPAPDRFGAFYGQSVSLTRFLVDRKSPQQFVQFLERARHTGYDSALRECYDIAGVGELDRQWHKHWFSVRPASFEMLLQAAGESSGSK